jgi:hypothetical protein
LVISPFKSFLDLLLETELGSSGIQPASPSRKADGSETVRERSILRCGFRAALKLFSLFPYVSF